MNVSAIPFNILVPVESNSILMSKLASIHDIMSHANAEQYDIAQLSRSVIATA